MIIGLMAVSDFPLTTVCLKDLAEHCDVVSIRYDLLNGQGNILGDCLHLLKYMNVKYKLITGKSNWNRWRWRSELVCSVADMSPGLILFPDHDEQFGTRWWESEIDTFIRTDAMKALFDYQMVTADGREVKRYPAAKHCKAFKFDPEVNFEPYAGYAIPNYPLMGAFESSYIAESKMKHLCFYTESMEENKILHK